MKCLIVIHRCLQDKDLATVIAKELKPKAHILTPYQPKKDHDSKINQRLVTLLSQQYVDYLQRMLKFISKTSLLSKKVSEAPKYVKKLNTSDIFLVYEEFDKFITIIFQVFENKEICRKSRLYQNFIYMMFLDLIKIYNVFYIMVTEILDRFKRMNMRDMERAYEIYKAFLGFTENVKREANSIPLVFGFVFKNPSYYTPDPKLEKTLQRCMQSKEMGGGEDFDDADFGMGDDFEAEDVYENRGFEQGGDSDDEEDDDIGGIDILGDVKQAEQFATHS